MLTIEQIRAARALLDWSQSDLADNAGLSQTGIARIENRTNKPNSSTLEKIHVAFDLAGVEFLGNSGVKRRTGEVRTLHGRDGFRSFMNEVYETVKVAGGEICLFNGVPEIFYRWLGEDWYHEVHAPRMEKIEDSFSFKIIISEAEKVFMARGFAEYRWFPQHMSSNKTIYAYGDKLAFLDFSDEDVTIQILSQSDFTDSFRILFNIAWENVAIKP